MHEINVHIKSDVCVCVYPLVIPVTEALSCHIVGWLL